MYHHIRDEVNSNISDIPIRNANQGLYPNCGTSRDYGYGVMGYPTFTFETDDEQFLLGTVEALSDRLAEELDVMLYLIENVWYWRARLFVDACDKRGAKSTWRFLTSGERVPLMPLWRMLQRREPGSRSEIIQENRPVRLRILGSITLLLVVDSESTLPTARSRFLTSETRLFLMAKEFSTYSIRRE